MACTRAELNTGTVLVLRALSPYAEKPDEQGVAALTDELLSHGELLLGHVAHLQAAAPALTDWHTLTTTGPQDHPDGNWNHTRALARTLRTLHRILGIGIPAPTDHHPEPPRNPTTTGTGTSVTTGTGTHGAQGRAGA
ncbi:DUF6415 family natural product biosynthesis protein [Streptomyces sp. NPDC051567]|uniref:DUF6415 family natural product biosynthesis protein n=1 Tax=Streptomyces sp. NPDC051567 TaxID=3365660 RepID=UPI0037BAA24A